MAKASPGVSGSSEVVPVLVDRTLLLGLSFYTGVTKRKIRINSEETFACENYRWS